VDEIHCFIQDIAMMTYKSMLISSNLHYKTGLLCLQSEKLFSEGLRHDWL